MKQKFPARIRELRGESSQTEFVRDLPIKQTAYSAWERGLNEPSYETLCQIVSMHNVSADWILGLSDDRRGTLVHTPDPVMLAKIKELEDQVASLTAELESVKGENTGLRFALKALGRGLEL